MNISTFKAKQSFCNLFDCFSTVKQQQQPPQQQHQYKAYLSKFSPAQTTPLFLHGGQGQERGRHAQGGSGQGGEKGASCPPQAWPCPSGAWDGKPSFERWQGGDGSYDWGRRGCNSQHRLSWTPETISDWRCRGCSGCHLAWCPATSKAKLNHILYSYLLGKGIESVAHCPCIDNRKLLWILCCFLTKQACRENWIIKRMPFMGPKYTKQCMNVLYLFDCIWFVITLSWKHSCCSTEPTNLNALTLLKSSIFFLSHLGCTFGHWPRHAIFVHSCIRNNLCYSWFFLSRSTQLVMGQRGQFQRDDHISS